MTQKPRKATSTHFTTLMMKSNALVKTFLENNFGTPALIPDRHIIMKHFAAQLDKNNCRPDDYLKYTEEVEVVLNVRNFIYDGFNISEQNTQNFISAVESYIRDLWRSNIDSLLMMQEKQRDWKKKYLELLHEVTGDQAVIAQKMKQVKKDLEEHEINIKKAIEHVVFTTLKLNFEVLAYETVKKDYYRYRIGEGSEAEKKSFTQLSRDIN